MAITLNGTTGITTPGLSADSPTLFVDSTNDRVGIGTDNPAEKLQVQGRVVGTSGLRAGTTAAVASSGEALSVLGQATIRLDTSTSATTYFVNADTTANTIQPYLFCSDTAGNRSGIGIEYSTAITSFYGQGGISLQTGTSGFAYANERLRITDAGNVGIGTVNPPAKLSVDGSVIFGNTTSSGSGGTLRVVESGNSVYIQPGSNTSNDSSCDLIVSSINGETEKLRIDSDGRVRLNGVAGVATFSARLHTNGNFHLRPIKDVTGTTPADAGVCIDILSDDNGTVNDLAIRGATTIFRNDSSETLRILSGGQVNIGGNYTQTTYTMQVTGTINATSNITQNGNALATNGKAIAMALIFG